MQFCALADVLTDEWNCQCDDVDEADDDVEEKGPDENDSSLTSPLKFKHKWLRWVTMAGREE